MQVTSEEIHDSVILVKQIPLHVCIIHLVTEYLAADAVASKTDTLGCHHWHPALGVFAKQKHGSNSQCTIGTDKSQIADLLHGFDYTAFFGKSDLERAKAISGGVDFLQAPEREEPKKLFIKEALLLRQALSLCQSLLNYEQRLEAAYFEAVRTLLTRIEGKGKMSLREINARINELLKQSIKSDGVINLFSDVEEEFSLFDPKFLEEISRMKERNFAVELLRKLIAEQVRIYQRTNTVRAEKFSEILSRAMSNYLKGLLTNEEVIQELLKIAHEIAHGKESDKALDLNDEELAFYDALTKPEAVRDFYTNEQLVAITRELTDALRCNKTIDWNLKESARAGMRRIVKRLLRKYDYPPEGQEDALSTIMKQCDMWSENS